MTTSEQQVQSGRTEHKQVVESGDTDVIGRRAVAVVIDTVLIILVLSVLLAKVVEPLLYVGIPVILLSAALGQFFYFYLLEGVFGRTPGKLVTRIVVRRKDGSKIGFSESLTRNLWRFVDSVFSYGVGFFIAISSEKTQRFGDKRADTLVVRR